MLPDAHLITRIAAIGDRSALAELAARHGLTLYALAYSATLDPDAADAAVAATFREVWCLAASFNAQAASAHRWLADLARRAIHDRGSARSF